MGSLRQSHRGEGAGQSVLDRGQHAVARHGAVRQIRNGIEPGGWVGSIRGFAPWACVNSSRCGGWIGAAEIAASRLYRFRRGYDHFWYTSRGGVALGGAQVNLNPDGSYSFQCYDGSGNLNLLSIADALRAGYVTATTSTHYRDSVPVPGRNLTQKPFRDWLTEVLNCCLGFYTWEFGKLKLGCRVNAGAADAYTLGNTLFQSLRLAPIQAAFEHLVVSFADVAYQYQANTAEYCDKSHAAYYGRAGSPLTSADALGGDAPR